MKGDGIQVGLVILKVTTLSGNENREAFGESSELLYVRNRRLGHCYLEEQCKHHSHQAAASLPNGLTPFVVGQQI